MADSIAGLFAFTYQQFHGLGESFVAFREPFEAFEMLSSEGADHPGSRETDDKRGAFPRLAAHPDLASVVADHRLHNGQP